MTNKRDKLTSKKRKRKNKGIDALIVVVFIILAGSVIWIGMNGLNKEKTSETSPDEAVDEFQPVEETENPDRTDTTEDVQDESNLSDTEDGAMNPDDEPLVDVEDEPLTAEPPTENAEEKADPKQPSNPIGYIEGQQLPEKPKFVDGVLLANKQYPLPADYAPEESEEARAAFNKMETAAKATGLNLQAFSTYRPYDYQVTLYERYVDRDGQKAADRYSARPGYSEHQTGLAFDIGEVNNEEHWASNSFGDTEAAKWLAANAYQYGFILRYPEGKEEITGYMHESWHYRYVGTDISEQIFKQNITLEEYLDVR